MSVLGPRFRERNSVVPANNRIRAGDLNVVNNTTQAVSLYAPVWATGTSTPAIRKKTWDEVHPGPPFLSGGPFLSVEIVRPEYNVQGQGSYLCSVGHAPGWTFRYDGGFYDPTWVAGLDEIPESEYNSIGSTFSSLYPDLTDLGSGAYARLRPKLSNAGLGQAIAEMRDLPKMLSTTSRGFSSIWNGIRNTFDTTRGAAAASRFRLKGDVRRYGRQAPKAASDQFLNQQFGWVPFLGDLMSVYDTYQNARKLKAQISRDNGSWIKRRRVDHKLESQQVVYHRTDHPGCQPYGYPFTTMYDATSFDYSVTLLETTEVWYEGQFKYYRPEFDWDSDKSKGLIAALRREMAIYGADLDPVLVWKVTPWSWLADWFTNAGDAIQRAQDWATDQLVSKYFYLMHRRRRFFVLNARFKTIDGKQHSYFWFRSADIKRRMVADSPFEFSLDGGDLSPRQLAILGALGISRS